MNKNAFSKITLILLLIASGYGCATEMPSTEGLVFAGKQKNSLQNQSSNTSFVSKLSWGMSISYNRIFPPGSFKRVAQRYYRSSTDTLSLFYLNGISISPSFSLYYGNRFAIGSNILPFPGFWQMDGTVRLFRQYYLTLSKKIFKPNTQVILERRLLYRNHGGLSLGVFYRYDLFKFEKSRL